MSVLQSLLLKLVMLAMTTGVVFWVGWQAPQAMQRYAPAEPAPLAQSDKPETYLSVRDVPNGSSVSAGEPEGFAREPRLVDLNRAGVKDFEQLPGVGPVLARRVVDYRTSRGVFHRVEDLRRVKGIGQKKLERLKRLVTVAPPAALDKGEKAAL